MVTISLSRIARKAHFFPQIVKLILPLFVNAEGLTKYTVQTCLIRQGIIFDVTQLVWVS